MTRKGECKIDRNVLLVRLSFINYVYFQGLRILKDIFVAYLAKYYIRGTTWVKFLTVNIMKEIGRYCVLFLDTEIFIQIVIQFLH